MGDRRLLIPTFVDLVETLADTFDLVELLSLLTDRCIQIFDVSATGVMLAGDDDQLHVMTATNERVRLLEQFEIETREGPCLDAYRSGEPVLSQPLAEASQRWPRFTPRALAAGFQVVEALPMRSRGQTIGALNLFHAEGMGLEADDLAAAGAMADIATIAILEHRSKESSLLLNRQLQQALDSRVVIEQAKGALAERASLDVEAAFERMRSYARRHALSLVTVARAVLDEKTTLATDHSE